MMRRLTCLRRRRVNNWDPNSGAQGVGQMLFTAAVVAVVAGIIIVGYWFFS